MATDDEKQPSVPKQLQEWTPEEKFAVVLQAASLSEGELGVFPCVSTSLKQAS
jgi:hypothetical protein